MQTKILFYQRPQQPQATARTVEQPATRPAVPITDILGRSFSLKRTSRWGVARVTVSLTWDDTSNCYKATSLYTVGKATITIEGTRIYIAESGHQRVGGPYSIDYEGHIVGSKISGTEHGQDMMSKFAGSWEAQLPKAPGDALR